MHLKNNIVLIGMPGVGKSTVGVILAKILGYKFIDTDIVIQNAENKLLKEIIHQEGVDGFINAENRSVSRLNAENSVIATGGSVVYGEAAMKHLSENGIIIYLKLDYNRLRRRLGNIKNRGVVIRPGQTLSELYNERVPLYEKYADIIIDENGCNIEKTVNNILAELDNHIVKNAQ
ncbi:MAG: shikimate kinase [Ruminococcus sp.]|nr:shikimate kinase [Ruminococcus sp.]